MELSCYSGLLQDQLNWETREYFLQLHEQLLANKITIAGFCESFSEREITNSETVSMLEVNSILLSPSRKALKFSKLIYLILEACYNYDPDSESVEIWERKNKAFQDFVQLIYLQSQKHIKE